MNISYSFKNLTIILLSFLSLLTAQKIFSEEIPLLEFDSIVFPEVSSFGMVATQEAKATEIGVSVLESGGNAVDAAVAVGFALAVTLPRAGNIGGGGFMMIYDHHKKSVQALDYREKAPIKASRDMFLDKNLNVNQQKSRYSVLSAGVPGTVAGLIEAHRKHGKLPLKKLMAPAIKLAQGMPMTLAMSQSLNARKNYLSKDKESQRIFVKNNNQYWKMNDVIRQPELANTLKLIADTHGKSFYFGETAKIIANYFKQHHGLITLEDLASYRAIWREPLSTQYGPLKFYSMPPPSSGGVHLIQLLNVLKNFPIKKMGANTTDETHIKTEAMKYAYADRSKFLGDPDFVKIPIKQLISSEYAAKIAKNINLKKATPSDKIKPGIFFDKESSQTTHYSIIDKEGNIVSNTYTLNLSFGSGITVPGVGMLLNNEMDDFSAKPGTANAYGLLGEEANAIESAKRPLSSMTPVIVLKDEKPWIATGSPGGSRIITIVFNFLLNRIVHNMNIAEATISPRVHHQWYPDKLFVEKSFPIDTARNLKNMGHHIVYRNPWGSLHSVEYENGVFYGFADPRRPGALAKGVNIK